MKNSFGILNTEYIDTFIDKLYDQGGMVVPMLATMHVDDILEMFEDGLDELGIKFRDCSDRIDDVARCFRTR